MTTSQKKKEKKDRKTAGPGLSSEAPPAGRPGCPRDPARVTRGETVGEGRSSGALALTPKLHFAFAWVTVTIKSTKPDLEV